MTVSCMTYVKYHGCFLSTLSAKSWIFFSTSAESSADEPVGSLSSSVCTCLRVYKGNTPDLLSLYLPGLHITHSIESMWILWVPYHLQPSQGLRWSPTRLSRMGWRRG
eukprot:jgi/Botrbrau1/17954/Bobra.50_1s0046.1